MTLNLFMATRQVCLNNQAYYSLIWSTSARPCHGKTNSWSNYKIAVNKSQAVNMLTRKYKVWKFPHQGGGGLYILFPPSPRILTDVRQDTTATMWRLSRRSCLRWCRREFFILLMIFQFDWLHQYHLRLWTLRGDQISPSSSLLDAKHQPEQHRFTRSSSSKQTFRTGEKFTIDWLEDNVCTELL